MARLQTNPLGTAIVTGASSGIGRVYADRLAARGYDLVLVARRADRLQAIAEDLQSRHPIRAEILVADLSSASDLANVVDRVSQDSSVSLVINNAGYSILKPLTETPPQVIDNMVALNITALTQLSRAALIAFKARNAGTLVNVGSAAGFAPYPDIPVYGATKAFIYLFTQSLQNEIEGSEVRIQLVLPGAVATEGWEVAGGAELEPLPDSITMTAEDCVDAALAGLDQSERVTAPSLHDLPALQSFEAQSASLLQSMFDRQPAARYGVRT